MSDDNAQFVTTIGRLERVKGQDNLIRVFALLTRESWLSGARLLFVGGGSKEAYLRRLAENEGIAERCIFAGEVAPSQISRWLQQTRIYVQPSRSEAFGLAVIQAMAYGLPCVVSDAGGLREIIENGVNGLLVDCTQVDELKAALLTLWCDRPMRRRLGEAAKGRAREFSMQAFAAKMAEAYERCLRATSQMHPEPC